MLVIQYVIARMQKRGNDCLQAVRCHLPWVSRLACCRLPGCLRLAILRPPQVPRPRLISILPRKFHSAPLQLPGGSSTWPDVMLERTAAPCSKPVIYPCSAFVLNCGECLCSSRLQACTTGPREEDHHQRAVYRTEAAQSPGALTAARPLCALPATTLVPGSVAGCVCHDVSPRWGACAT